MKAESQWSQCESLVTTGELPACLPYYQCKEVSLHPRGGCYVVQRASASLRALHWFFSCFPLPLWLAWSIVFFISLNCLMILCGKKKMLIYILNRLIFSLHRSSTQADLDSLQGKLNFCPGCLSFALLHCRSVRNTTKLTEHLVQQKCCLFFPCCDIFLFRAESTKKKKLKLWNYEKIKIMKL